MTTVEQSDMTKAEAFEFGLMVGSLNLGMRITKEEGDTLTRLQAKLLNKAVDRSVFVEIAAGFLSSKGTGEIIQRQVDAFVSNMVEDRMARLVGDKVILIVPLANNLDESENFFAALLARTNESFPELAHELLRGYKGLMDKGVLRADNNGDLEMTELGNSHAKLLTMMAVCGKNISNAGPFGDAVLKLKEEGILRIDRFGTIDIVPDKMKRFFDEFEQLIRFSDAEFDKDKMLKDLKEIRAQLLGE